MSSDTDATPTEPTPQEPPRLSTGVVAAGRGASPDDDPTEAWPQLHRRLNAILRQRIDAGEFSTRLEFVEMRLLHLVEHRQDDSLFLLVQMLFDRHYSYSATHALLSALTCALIAPLGGIEGDEQRALIRAALTMNMGMADLHDQLAIQTQCLDEQQRQTIQEHPQLSAAKLREFGVTDARWLQLVADHHETADGTGYPDGKTVSDPVLQLLHMADVFVARISPRSTRRGLSPNIAVGNLYLEAQEQEGASQLGAIFAKQLGMYPPGTYVRLKNEETAVVVRRGQRVNTPLTMAIADPSGMPLSTPGQRDTQIPTYGVKGAVAPEDIKIRLDHARLLKRR